MGYRVDWVAKRGGTVKRTYYFDTAALAKAHVARMKTQNAREGYVAKASKT